MLQPLIPISLAVLLGTISIPVARCASPPKPKAFNWEPSGYWEGSDGFWSTFYIRVGTPEKYVRVLPSTNWQETFVILPLACPDSLTPDDPVRLIDPKGKPVLCSEARGLVADVNASSTWFGHPPFAKLDLDNDLVRDYANANGLYGQDKLGLTVKDSGLTLTQQVIAGIVTPDWWIGVFGLGNLTTNFNGFNNPQESFLVSAYNQGHIPSLTWGYQPGANYQLKATFGSVTFGGYDKSRFNGDLMFFSNSYQAFTLRGLSYVTDADKKKPYELLDEADDDMTAVLDSSIPYMYLQNKTVTAMEKAFNLTYNATQQLYILTEEQHDSLKKVNPTFTFSLSDNKTSEVMNITVPYAAFDLQAGQGYLNENRTVYYFPLRRATEDTGTILGRAFMQEVYVHTDYQRNRWGLAQAAWKDNYDADIVTVLTPGNETASDNGGGSSKTGAIAGGAVGGVVALAALAGLGIFFYRKKHKPDGEKNKEKDNLMPTPPFAELGGAQVNNPRYEVDGTDSPAGNPNNLNPPIGVGAWSNENKIEAVEIDGTSTGTPLTTPATDLGSPDNRFPPNAVVAELDGGPVFLPEMEGSTPRNEEKGFRFGRPDMPTPPPPPGPPPPGDIPPPPDHQNQQRFSR